ncbi:reverse transcriptase domain protein [Paraphaeosphaeria sporulosa]
MSKDSELITKVTVILDQPTDWEPWYQIIRDKALVNKIWMYCDISMPKEGLPQLREPTKPTAASIKPTATAISDLSSAEQSILAEELSDWRSEKAIFKEKEHAIGELMIEITRTIARRHLYLIKDKDNLYDRLSTLKMHIALTTATRNRELAMQYRSLQERPRGRNLDNWLDDWVQITALCGEAKLPDVLEHRAQIDFLTAVRAVAPEWAALAHFDLIRKESTGQATSILSLEALVAEFRSYHRQTKPVAASLGTFATLGVADQSQDEAQITPNSRKGMCLCGASHKWINCWYLNSNHPKRPEGFRGKQAAKVAEALENYRTREAVKRAFTKAGVQFSCNTANQASQGPMRFDDDSALKRPGQSFAILDRIYTSATQETLDGRKLKEQPKETLSTQETRL